MEGGIVPFSRFESCLLLEVRSKWFVTMFNLVNCCKLPMHEGIDPVSCVLLILSTTSWVKLPYSLSVTEVAHSTLRLTDAVGYYPRYWSVFQDDPSQIDEASYWWRDGAGQQIASKVHVFESSEVVQWLRNGPIQLVVSTVEVSERCEWSNGRRNSSR